MLVVFYGTNRGAVRDAASAYVDALPADTTLTTIEAPLYQVGRVADALGATSLFGGGQCFILDMPSEEEAFLAAVKESLAELASSPNTFIVLEEVLLAADKKAYAKYASELIEYKAVAGEKFNAFALAEALAAKDKRRLWIELQSARLAGMNDEAIIGMFWWQLKALRLAGCTNSAAEAGMKEFPYSKAKRALSKFAPGEIERFSQSLLKLYHDGHAGVREMSIALERWVLEL